MIRIGQGVLAVGVALLIFSTGKYAAAVAMVLIGLGCAPIYPCVIHSTPANFGEENSQALVGVQMASAYTGSLTMAPLFGLWPGICPWVCSVLSAGHFAPDGLYE